MVCLIYIAILPDFIFSDSNILTEKLTLLEKKFAINSPSAFNDRLYVRDLPYFAIQNRLPVRDRPYFAIRNPFSRSLMDIRTNIVEQVINYRRKCFRFPESKQRQFQLVLKLYLYEFQRRIWPVETNDSVKNHLATVYLLEHLYSDYLTQQGIDFAKIEGWDIRSKANSVCYSYNDTLLNQIHNK